MKKLLLTIILFNNIFIGSLVIAGESKDNSLILKDKITENNYLSIKPPPQEFFPETTPTLNKRINTNDDSVTLCGGCSNSDENGCLNIKTKYKFK